MTRDEYNIWLSRFAPDLEGLNLKGSVKPTLEGHAPRPALMQARMRMINNIPLTEAEFLDQLWSPYATVRRVVMDDAVVVSEESLPRPKPFGTGKDFDVQSALRLLGDLDKATVK